jgi:predicted RNase H-like HicB family nuclease
MKTIHAVLEINKDGYGVWFDEIETVWAWGETVEKAKKDAQDALNIYINLQHENNQPLPECLQGDWELDFRFHVPALLAHYKGIFTKAALSRVTGVNASLLSQYLMGIKEPRPAQLKKIKTGIHNLGKELIQIDL